MLGPRPQGSFLDMFLQDQSQQPMPQFPPSPFVGGAQPQGQTVGDNPLFGLLQGLLQSSGDPAMDLMDTLNPVAAMPMIRRGGQEVFELATDPGLLNRMKWFHGGKEKLYKETASPMKHGKISGNLFGPGLYTTEAETIGKGYMKSGGVPGMPKTKTKGVLSEARTKFPENAKILNLEEPSPDNVKELFRKRFMSDPDFHDSPELEAVLKKKNVTTEELYGAMQEDLSYSGAYASDADDAMGDLNWALRDELGYDALTHTGGKRTGNDPHQVLIHLSDEWGGEELPSLRSMRPAGSYTPPGYGLHELNLPEGVRQVP